MSNGLEVGHEATVGRERSPTAAVVLPRTLPALCQREEAVMLVSLGRGPCFIVTGVTQLSIWVGKHVCIGGGQRTLTHGK